MPPPPTIELRSPAFTLEREGMGSHRIRAIGYLPDPASHPELQPGMHVIYDGREYVLASLNRGNSTVCNSTGTIISQHPISCELELCRYERYTGEVPDMPRVNRISDTARVTGLEPSPLERSFEDELLPPHYTPSSQSPAKPPPSSKAKPEPPPIEISHNPINSLEI